MTLRDEDWKTDDTAQLFKAIISLETETQAADFFRDLCTRKELEEMSHRWEAVKLLDQKIPYREISNRTGLSTATITRINQWLQHGTGGYQTMLARLGEKQ